MNCRAICGRNTFRGGKTAQPLDSSVLMRRGAAWSKQQANRNPPSVRLATERWRKPLPATRANSWACCTTCWATRRNARDAYQETFVKCWRNRGQVESVQNLKAWIFRIALNTGRDMRQTAYRRHRRALPEDEAEVACHRNSAEAEVEYNEQMKLVREAVSQLRTEEKEVFLLRQNAEMTYEEIAEALRIPSGTVKTRMRLALIKLRATLAEAT